MDGQRYRAAWVFPVDGAPISDGTVEIDAIGRIAAVHNRHDPRAIDLGNVAIIPGLVNAHTHLEFSDIESPLGPREPFTDWIRAVVAYRHRRESDCGDVLQRGLTESQRSGTTVVGEIATSDESFADSESLTVLFRELIGLRPDQIEEQVEIARRHLEQPTEADSRRVISGISPHAPYSVHPELFARLVELSRDRRCPLAIHLAETRAELELLAQGTGPFVELLRDFGVWRDDVIPTGSRPLDYLQQMADIECGLVIHGNYLADDEIEFLAAHHNLAVVYCPRTHAYFRHDAHPWLDMLARGARVAIGTDSRASNPDLSVWKELCFLHGRQPDVDPKLLLELGTICGARALGVEKETGSLTVGKRADLVVVELADSDVSNPHSQLLSSKNAIAGTMCGGKWVHRVT